MWKDLANNASFENSQKIGWQVNCDECGKICRKTHNLKFHKWLDDKLIAIIVERFCEQLILRWMEKDLANKAQSENSQMIGW